MKSFRNAVGKKNGAICCMGMWHSAWGAPARAAWSSPVLSPGSCNIHALCPPTLCTCATEGSLAGGSQVHHLVRGGTKGTLGPGRRRNSSPFCASELRGQALAAFRELLNVPSLCHHWAAGSEPGVPCLAGGSSQTCVQGRKGQCLARLQPTPRPGDAQKCVLKAASHLLGVY